MSAPNPVPSTAASTPTVAMAPSEVSVVVLSKDQPANGIIRIKLRANSDPASDSHATFHVQDGTQIDPTTKAVIPATTTADIQAWVAQEKARVAREYSAMTLAHSTLIAAIGT